MAHNLSDIPPTSTATTGTPEAAASSTALGNASGWVEGRDRVGGAEDGGEILLEAEQAEAVAQLQLVAKGDQVALVPRLKRRGGSRHEPDGSDLG